MTRGSQVTYYRCNKVRHSRRDCRQMAQEHRHGRFRGNTRRGFRGRNRGYYKTLGNYIELANEGQSERGVEENASENHGDGFCFVRHINKNKIL